jgi:hypothetical protein
MAEEQTAEKIVEQSRCALPKDIENDLRVEATLANRNLCEQAQKAVEEHIYRAL